MNVRPDVLAKGVAVVLLVASVVTLWVFPIMLFRQPSLNEGIGLAAWVFPIFALLSLAAVASLLFRSRWPAVPISFGVYLLGVACDLIFGFFSFGNGSDDRYMPLVVLPFFVGLAGLVSLVGGVTAKRRVWLHVWLGTVIGLASAIIVGIWVLLRGARDWLLAPYGFDVTLLVVVIAVAVITIGSMIRGGRALTGDRVNKSP